MMGNYLIAMGAIALLLMGWVTVQHLTRLYARRHPEFGPAREEGAGCGSSCLCASGGRCRKEGSNQ